MITAVISATLKLEANKSVAGINVWKAAVLMRHAGRMDYHLILI